jgi:hypothetical protein
VHTTTIEEARGIIWKEIETLQRMKEHKEVAKRGILHLKEYLLDYWTTD